MKKAFATVLTLALLCALCCACFTAQAETTEKSKEDLFDALVPYGGLEPLELEEDLLEKNLGEIWTENNDKYMRTYSDPTEMLEALENGEIKLMYCPEIIARRIQALNPDLICVNSDGINFFSMAVLPEQEELCGKLNEAIAELDAKGELDRIEEAYLNGDSDFRLADSAEDCETLRVAVTGDYAPIDSMDGDKVPCGYSAALLQAIGDKLGCEIEPVFVENSERMSALRNGDADVIFMVRLQDDTDKLEMPSGDLGLLLTTPYLSCADCAVSTDQATLDDLLAYYAIIHSNVAE